MTISWRQRGGCRFKIRKGGKAVRQVRWLRRIPWFRALVATGIAWALVARRGERSETTPVASVIDQRLDDNCSFDLRIQSSLGEALQRFSEITQIPVRFDDNLSRPDSVCKARLVYVRIPLGT